MVIFGGPEASFLKMISPDKLAFSLPLPLPLPLPLEEEEEEESIFSCVVHMMPGGKDHIKEVQRYCAR